MVKILVTGATGGLGRDLVPLLAARGASVVATGRNADIGVGLKSDNVRFVVAELRNHDLAALVDGIDVVVHLAARSSPWGRLADFHADNVDVTERLLGAATTAGVRRFVYASSPSIFAERRHRLRLRGHSPAASRPINHYARTKLVAEHHVANWPGMQTLVLRPSAIIGPNDRAILPRLMRVLSRGVLPVGNRGTALFHPTDVRDAADAFAVAALGSATGLVNIAGRAPVNVGDLAGALAQRLRKGVRTVHIPETALHVLAGLSEAAGRISGREPPFTRYSMSTLSWSRTFDIGDAEATLGWTPRYDAWDALRHAVPA